MPGGYDAEYFAKVYGKGSLRPLSGTWFSARYHAAVSRRLLRQSGGKRVLEIGCGHGFVLGFLAGAFEVTGVDVSPYALDLARKRVPGGEFIRADLERGLPEELAGREYDLVIARYVLEHLRQPATTVRAAFRALKTGGRFFLAVPNTQSLGQRLKGGDWYARKDPTHVSLLDPEAWLSILTSSGFSLCREFGDGYWDLPYLKGVPSWLQAPLFLPPTALMCLSGRPLLPKRFGENLLIVAERPAAAEAPANRGGKTRRRGA